MPSRPTTLNDCQCTVCYKYGALWAYFPRNTVTVIAPGEGSEGLQTYVRDDAKGSISFNRCAHCGCMTHWWGLDTRSAEDYRMGVNFRMMLKADIEGIERIVTPGP